jgi:hypothetical protein
VAVAVISPERSTDTGEEYCGGGRHDVARPESPCRKCSRCRGPLTWLTEWRLPCQSGGLAADLGPPRDQILFGACQAAQAPDLLGAGPLVLTLSLSGPELDPSLLGEQVGPPGGHVAELGRARGFLGFGQAAPAGMTPGDAGYTFARLVREASGA